MVFVLQTLNLELMTATTDSSQVTSPACVFAKAEPKPGVLLIHINLIAGFEAIPLEEGQSLLYRLMT